MSHSPILGVCLLMVLSVLNCSALINIIDEGAIVGTDTLQAQFTNAKIIKQSILKANSSAIDRVVKIPGRHTFYSMPIILSDIHHIHVII